MNVLPPSAFSGPPPGPGAVGNSNGGSAVGGSLVSCPHPPAKVTFVAGAGHSWNFQTQTLNLDPDLLGGDGPGSDITFSAPLIGDGTPEKPITLAVELVTDLFDEPLGYWVPLSAIPSGPQATP